MKNILIKFLFSLVCLINSLPFVGFGFLDNFTMIIAGDYIEYSVGTVMTISTMAAAALGNTISDVLGIGSAVYVERIVEVIGIRPPDLTPIQMEMKSARRASNFVSFFYIQIYDNASRLNFLQVFTNVYIKSRIDRIFQCNKIVELAFR